jgi:outer membrane receptor protein involved in Fe transport
MSLRKLLLLSCLSLLIFTYIPRMFAQAVTGTLLGTVSDNNGAVIPDAKVTITEQQTGASLSQTTNASGNYQFVFLPPGIYTVSASSPGFTVKVTKDVQVSVNITMRIDVTLPPGSVAQTVTVTDQAPLLQTDRADVSAQIASEQVEDLPVGSTGNFQQLESLVPGVSPPVYDQSSFFNAQHSQSFQVNGQGELGNNLKIEGVDDNQLTGLLQVYIPPAAAIQTVDVETSNYAPEFGRAGGAVTNVILKSGTNSFHGSAYEYNSISATSARDYFNNDGALPRFSNNYYGGTVGGPIRKNHTYFFGDFLRYSYVNSSYDLFTMPTAAFRAGDLSTSPTPIYDPVTGNPDGTGRTQFAGNVIPHDRLSPVALNLLALLPGPNVPGAGFTNNYQVTPGFLQQSDQFDAKVDQILNKTDHLALRYSWQYITTVQDTAYGTVVGGPAVGGHDGHGSQNTYNTAGEYTHVFSSTLFTEARIGINHYTNDTEQSDYGMDTSTQVGIPGANTDLFSSGLSEMKITGFSAPMFGYDQWFPWTRAESNIDAVNDWIKISGNHTIKAGVEVLHNRQDLTQIQFNDARGAFSFTNGTTALNAPNAPATGFANAFASFLLGLPSSVGRDDPVGDLSWRETLTFAFIQDTWQILPHLTLTFGLRWEYYPPATPKSKGGFSQYIPDTNSLEVSGYGNIPNTLGLKTRWADFEPRLGFSYRLTPVTVVRGGFATSNAPFPNNASAYAYNYPVDGSTNFNPVNSYTPALDNSGQWETLSEGFPTVTALSIQANGIIPNANVNANYNVLNLNYKDPRVASYNLTIERDLGRQWVADVAYVGNQGRQLSVPYDLNGGTVPGAGAAGQAEYSTFGRTAQTFLINKEVTSNYNSLQAKLTRRVSNGLLWTSSFAWQKAMGYTSESGGIANWFFYVNPHKDYSELAYNVAETYAQSVAYDLPFGKNKPMLNQGLASQIAGGWKLGSILEFQTGMPLDITASGASLNAPDNVQVANQVAQFRKLGGVGTTENWFDPTSFVDPTTAALGNVAKYAFAGPSQLIWDASMLRAFPIHKAVVLQFQANAFNVLNHPNFALPDSNVGDASFGQVTSTTSEGAALTSSSGRTLQFAAKLRF